MSEQLSYTQAVAELEAIVVKMQSDECDIDSLAGYNIRALELLKSCKQKLFTTDQEVKKCLEALTNIQ